MKLISDKLNSQLNDIVGKCFAINRMLDRGMSLLTVRWKMIKTEKVLHPKVAHAYPGDLFADGVSGYQAKRSNETIYPQTPIGDRDYASYVEFFKDYFNENIELEDMIKDAINEAIVEDDLTTKQFLDNMLGNLVPFTSLSMDLVDLSEKYGTDPFKMQVFDSVIEDYVNV